MPHIRNRNDLFKILETKLPCPAIGTALDTGKAELLGGFWHVPPSTNPGWIIQVISKRGTKWNVVLTPHTSPNRISTWLAMRIPWEYWAGKTDRDPTIYDGDNPHTYAERRKKSRIQHGFSLD